MAKLGETLKKAVEAGKVPHVVVAATNKDGSWTYKHAAGHLVLGKDEPIPEDALFMLASQTKLLTSIAALQVVEKGLIGLDDDVKSVLPDLAEQKILKGFNDKDEPILEERKEPITLRKLLTHTAGLSYDAMHPNLTKYNQQCNPNISTAPTVETRMLFPLIYEPGTSWQYSTGIDWAGKLAERLTKSTLEDLFHKYLLQPLGIPDKEITFWPSDEQKKKIPALTSRTPEGKLILNTDPTLNAGSKDCFGGHGGFATMGAYIKVLHSILANDGKVLKPETVKELFTPQLGQASKEALKAFRAGPLGVFLVGENDPNIEGDWGLGGILFMQDDVGRRKKGTLSWGGMTNPFWMIDPEGGVAMAFGTQVLPPGDRPTAATITACELAVYEMAGVKFDNGSKI